MTIEAAKTAIVEGRIEEGLAEANQVLNELHERDDVMYEAVLTDWWRFLESR